MADQGTRDELVEATIRTAIDEWRVQDDQAETHGVSMPEYIRRALADAGLLATRENLDAHDRVVELEHDTERVHNALLPILRNHNWTAHEVRADGLWAGYVAERAAGLLRRDAIVEEKLQRENELLRDGYKAMQEQTKAMAERIRELEASRA